MNHTMQIGKRTISAASPTFTVAEVSANHNQNYDRAVEIIHAKPVRMPSSCRPILPIL